MEMLHGCQRHVETEKEVWVESVIFQPIASPKQNREPHEGSSWRSTWKRNLDNELDTRVV